MAWARSQPLGPVDFRFEEGDDWKGDSMRLHELRVSSDPAFVGSLGFVPKAEFPAQAADMHAYESWKQLVNRRASGTLRPFRRSLANLAQDVPVMDTHIDEGPLQELIAAELAREKGEGTA